MKPELILGNVFNDERGILQYNNDFNSSLIKRIYFIENTSIELERGWQGHKIEERWFTVVTGSVKINLVKIENWETPDHNLEPEMFVLNCKNYNVLHVPAGYITCIQSVEKNSKLMVMSNFVLGEINDEFRFPLETFKRK